MKLAVIFPGIRYHVDKPLLFYSKKIAASHGFEIVEVPYGNFPADVKGSPEKMREAFQSALRQSEEMLRNVEFGKYDTILFISKSIGTAVAAEYARRRQIQTKNVYYTPVKESMAFMEQPGIVFHGTADNWVGNEELTAFCKAYRYPLYLIGDGNHSLETGHVLFDINNLRNIMEATEKYIESI